MTRPPTLRDVARIAGVSTATVSYVLSGRAGGVKPPPEATRERVLRAVEEVGYRRDQTARSLRRGRTELVCLVHTAPADPWTERLTEQLYAAAAERGYAVVTLPIAGGPMSEPTLRVLRERYVDGAIVMSDSGLARDELGALAGRGLALVVFDDHLQAAGFDVVRQGRGRAIRAAVEHLLASGRRRFAYLAHTDVPSKRVPVKRRSVERALAVAGLELSAVLPVADSRADTYAAVRGLLTGRRRPDALVSATDRAAISAVGAAKDLGLRVPDDLAVVGIGNLPEGAGLVPALSTVGADPFDFDPVVERLFTRLAAKEPLPGTAQRLPWRYLPRATS